MHELKEITQLACLPLFPEFLFFPSPRVTCLPLFPEFLFQ